MNQTLFTSKPLLAVISSFVRMPYYNSETIKFFTKKLLVSLITLFAVFKVFAQKTDTFTSTGAGTWTAPYGVTSITVEVWGAGGAGTGVGVLGSNGKNSAGGGGSGGGFVKSTYAVSGGTTYNFNIGAGGSGPSGSDGGASWFFNATTIKAIGGNGAGAKIFADNASGDGASAPIVGNIGGTLHTYGGNGAAGVAGSAAGGGGSSAGNTVGLPALGSNGGAAPDNGYSGANAPGGNGSNGSVGGIGAGGSGAKKGSGTATPNGGDGGDGQIKITYSCPIISAGPNQTLAACATTTTLAATAITAPATGVWTVVSGSGSVTTSTSATSGVTGIVPGTPLVLGWTVTNGNCGTSFSDVTITSPIGSGCLAYCTPSSTSNSDYISSFITSGGITNINNPSGGISASGYGNFYATHSASQYAGNSLNFTEVYNGGNHGFSIWVDFNNNGIFETSERLYNSATTATAFNGTVAIPAAIPAGDYRMRIRAWWNNLNPDPCTSITYGEAEDYKLTVLSSTPCSGTPIPGTTVLTPATGAPSSAFTATITGSSSGSGLSYQWQIADALAGPYNDISGQTGASANLTAVPSAGTTKFYRRKITCSNGGASDFSVGVAFTTTIYCTPTTATPTNTFITDVRFLGTLNDVTNNNNGYSNGYQNFTASVGKTKQAAGEGINVFVKSNDVDVVFKAWVDWNKDGLFDNTGPITSTSELVFSSGTRAISTTFGIVIPPGTAPGDYVIRIRNNRYACADPSGYCGSTSSDACTNFTGTNYGEAEDYIITVTANCAANVVAVSGGIFCGPGSITLSAKGTTGTTKLQWFSDEAATNLLAETPVDGSLSASFPTPVINNTTTYYVRAFNGTCKSIYTTPIVARIRPVPNISFDLPLADANFCGDDNTLKLNSAGSQEQIVLLEENFDSGLGVFSARTGTNADFTATTNTSISFPLSGVDNSSTSNTGWQNKPSIYRPVGAIWSPAISSGFGTNKFAYATSDYPTRRVHTILSTTTSYNTIDFTSLKLSFSAYYSYYGDTSAAAGGTVEGLFVEVSTDGNTWTTVKPYYTSLGFGTRFDNLSVDLIGYVGNANLKVRFRYLAYWGDGLGIDNVKLFGDKPLSTSFVWTAPNIGIYQSNCSTPYVDGTPTSSVCIKPTDAQLQTIASWNISALATLSNGCTTTGVIAVKNNNKVWDTTTSTTWGATDKWLPTNEIPDIGKCVIVKKPVTLVNVDGFAKNIKIIPGGSLTIKKDKTLTVTDYIKNETTPLATNESNFVLETDGNLIQLNNGAANSGRMTAQRQVNGLRYNPGSAVDYIYWSSPVGGQKTKNTAGNTDGFSPGTANTNFFYYNESNDRFYETGDLTFRLGRGYAVQAERDKGTSYNKMYQFKGTPNNGDIPFPLAFTNSTHGYNLVGNPYPSNINFDQLSLENKGLIYNTAWFWTNNVYTANQMGSGYTGNNYAVYNGSGGTPATYNPQSPYLGSLVPNGIIKVGQGFIVQAKMAGTLNFKNKYDDTHILRVNTTANFYSKNSTTKNRFWINLLSPSQLANSQLIAYVQGATNGFEQDYDAEAFDNYSDLFYSVIPSKKLLIQGRNEVFTDEDKVTLGANFFQNGTYTIALENAEGIFDGSQNIYLKDKQEGIITNLSQGSYTFTAMKADNATRFEIIYKPEAVLATGDLAKDQIIVYRDRTDFIIKSPKALANVEVYDNSGKLMVVLKPTGTTAILDASAMPNGGYILKIKTKDGDLVSRKIVR